MLGKNNIKTKNSTLLVVCLCLFVLLGFNSCKSSTDSDELSVELSDSYAEVTKWCSCFFGIKNGSGNYDIIVSDNQGVEASFDKVNNRLVVKGLKEGYYDVGLIDKATRNQVSARVWVLPQALILVPNRGNSTTDSFLSSHYDLFLMGDEKNNCLKYLSQFEESRSQGPTRPYFKGTYKIEEENGKPVRLLLFDAENTMIRNYSLEGSEEKTLDYLSKLLHRQCWNEKDEDTESWHKIVLKSKACVVEASLGVARSYFPKHSYCE